jgi:prophage regulatory protein
VNLFPEEHSPPRSYAPSIVSDNVPPHSGYSRKGLEDNVSEKPRFLRLPDVEHRTGLRRTQLHHLEVRDRFPKRIKLSDRASGWLEAEVDAWIAARVASRSASAAPTKADSAVAAARLAKKLKRQCAAHTDAIA